MVRCYGSIRSMTATDHIGPLSGQIGSQRSTWLLIVGSYFGPSNPPPSLLFHPLVQFFNLPRISVHLCLTHTLFLSKYNLYTKKLVQPWSVPVWITNDMAHRHEMTSLGFKNFNCEQWLYIIANLFVLIFQ